jgi:hypothetical protein
MPETMMEADLPSGPELLTPIMAVTMVRAFDDPGMAKSAGIALRSLRNHRTFGNAAIR